MARRDNTMDDIRILAVLLLLPPAEIPYNCWRTPWRVLQQDEGERALYDSSCRISIVCLFASTMQEPWPRMESR